MTIIHEPGKIREYLRVQAEKGSTIGFVPTMGALHEGHTALVERSLGDGNLTVCSIFVNPTQFNVRSDYNQYPVRMEADLRLLNETGAQVLFLPSVSDMYPDGTSDLERYDLGFLETVLEGKYRPGHFQGVCQVMSRLLRAVNADKVYMGQKDYQQCMVINRLLEQHNFKTKLEACPTIREADGLAMSSRNLRLNASDRAKAPAIYKTLTTVKNKIAPGNLENIKAAAVAALTGEGFKVDYFEIADAHTLESVDHWEGTQPLVALVAAFLGEVRLIDNLLLNR